MAQSSFYVFVKYRKNKSFIGRQAKVTVHYIIHVAYRRTSHKKDSAQVNKLNCKHERSVDVQFIYDLFAKVLLSHSQYQASILHKHTNFFKVNQ